MSCCSRRSDWLNSKTSFNDIKVYSKHLDKSVCYKINFNMCISELQLIKLMVIIPDVVSRFLDFARIPFTASSTILFNFLPDNVVYLLSW
jgi:hypothetical protein